MNILPALDLNIKDESAAILFYSLPEPQSQNGLYSNN
jgi:hypothetical protein